MKTETKVDRGVFTDSVGVGSMTNDQRDAIGSPTKGTLILNTDTELLNYHDGTQWQFVGSSAPVAAGIDFIQQTARIDQNATLTGGSTLTSAFTSTSGSGVFNYSSGTYTMLRDADVFLSFSLQGGSDVQASIKVNGAGVAYDYTNINGTVGSVSWSSHLAIGDTFSFFNSGAQSSPSQHTSVLANAKVSNLMSTSALYAQNDKAVSFTSSTKIPSGTGHYHALTGNSITLGPGTYRLLGSCEFSASGAPGYTNVGCGWFAANGADDGVIPSPLTGMADVTVNTSGVYTDVQTFFTPRPDYGNGPVPEVEVTVMGSSATFYLVTYAALTTAANARIKVFPQYKKLNDFWIYGAYAIPPTVTRLTSGSGTYTTPAGVRYLKIKMVGGGGGGAGNGTAPGAGGNGGTTTFGTSLLTATGGNGGAASSPLPSTGGTATVNSPAITVQVFGGGAGGGGSGGSASTPGGAGGNSYFGGAGPGGGAGQVGIGASANSGSGGSGAGGLASVGGSAAGGAAGGYLEAILINPSATYPYAVGAGGTFGAAGGGTGAIVGAAGADGVIIIEEVY